MNHDKRSAETTHSGDYSGGHHHRHLLYRQIGRQPEQIQAPDHSTWRQLVVSTQPFESDGAPLITRVVRVSASTGRIGTDLDPAVPALKLLNLSRCQQRRQQCRADPVLDSVFVDHVDFSALLKKTHD